MMVGRVIVDPVRAGGVAVSVRGVVNAGGAGSERAVERSFLTVGIGGMARLAASCRMCLVGKEGDAC